MVATGQPKSVNIPDPREVSREHQHEQDAHPEEGADHDDSGHARGMDDMDEPENDQVALITAMARASVTRDT